MKWSVNQKRVSLQFFPAEVAFEFARQSSHISMSLLAGAFSKGSHRSCSQTLSRAGTATRRFQSELIASRPTARTFVSRKLVGSRFLSRAHCPCQNDLPVNRNFRSSPQVQSVVATNRNGQPGDPATFDSLEPRTFSIIAHVDHGKSTLADRLLELTGTIPKDGSNKQVLDKLKVERDRGITVKSQAVSMLYEHTVDDSPPRKLLLNLIDTPGHVDFAYEVSRSLAACQFALLVVDATQGVQAQTIANLRLAQQLSLPLIPILNKIDLPASDPDRCLLQLEELGIDTLDPLTEPLSISAKTGAGVPEVLRAIVERTQPMAGTSGGAVEQREGEGLRALVFDSWYDSFRGVIALVSIKDGAMRKGDMIKSAHSGRKYEILDIGVNYPDARPTKILRKGQVGWVICNMKDMREATIGDTMHLAKESIEPLPGFKPSVPMVYASACKWS